jgi:AGZA family xanthine/uracil permease-like MFS transporter
MGTVANYPFAIAAGLGLNAVVAFQLVGAEGLTYPEAMGVVVTEGVIITLLVLTGFREAVLEAIPVELKKAIGAGIGLFIAIIGFAGSGVIEPGPGGGAAVLGRADLSSPRVGVFFIGLLLTVVLVALRVKGALLLGILATTVIAMVANAIGGGGLWGDTGIAQLPTQIVALPDFSLIGAFSFGYVGKLGLLAAVLAVFTLLLADFFDTMGTAIGLGREGGFLDADDRLPGMQRVLLVDSIAAAVGGATSSSSNTTYIESASGIAEGGRTGLTSVVTGALFLLAIFFSPIAGVIPSEATAPVLIVVGFLMLSVTREIPWDDYATAIPAFLTIVVMPFTYSITDGIGAGFVTYVVLAFATGRRRTVHWMLLLSAVLFVLYFAIDPIRAAMGV